MKKQNNEKQNIVNGTNIYYEEEATTQGTIHAFAIYDDGVEMGEVYLYFDKQDRIVCVSLALDMPVGDEKGTYMIPGFHGDDVFTEFVKNVIEKNKGIMDFVAFPQDYAERYPQLEEFGFIKMPFHEDYVYRPL